MVKIHQHWCKRGIRCAEYHGKVLDIFFENTLFNFYVPDTKNDGHKYLHAFESHIPIFVLVVVIGHANPTDRFRCMTNSTAE